MPEPVPTNERLRELAESLRMHAHWKAVKAADHIRDFGGTRAPFYMGTLQGAEEAYLHAADLLDKAAILSPQGGGDA